MGSTVKQFGAIDANGQHPRDGHASPGEKRTASGTAAGDWLVNVTGDVVVPMTTAEIVEGLRAGKLSERSLVWRLGMQDWIVLGDVPQLRLASGNARASSLPPASARVPHTSLEAPSEPLRPRNTLPYGFPAARDPASVRQPSGVSLPSPLATPVSAPRSLPRAIASEDEGALAVYDRPAASLTFSDSVAAEWHGKGRLVPQSAPPPSAPADAARRLTPVPAVAAPLSQSPRSAFPNSLVPTTSELAYPPSSRPPNHADLSVVLASDFRAAKASSKRRAVWAAFGSAAVASALTLWLVRTPSSVAPVTSLAAQPVVAQPVVQPVVAQPVVQPVIAPPAMPPIVQLPYTSASAVIAPPKAVAPRVPRAARARPKTAPRVEPVLTAPASQPESSDNPYDLGPTSEPSEARATSPASAAPSDSQPAPAPEAAPAAPAADPPSAP